ncbi:outer envelope pore protein 16-1 [Citrus sinensis]|uniref:Outer envelope pore protein 16-1 n=1 Tax=Citrus sinensis TaxID=2711 RepID=A0ACB8IWH5_CITSI|nr:outer envelope pore protein 16-1 [Citrus sinensis]
MPKSSFAGALTTPRVDVGIDMGNDFLNHTVDGFLKIGAVISAIHFFVFCYVAATRAVAEDTYNIVKGGNFSRHHLENALKKMCKEGAYWGTVAGVYVGMEYGVEKVRGTKDWLSLSLDILQKNAMIGGAFTGALVSAVGKNNRDKVVMDALTGGAIAAAAEFLSYRS